MYQIEVLVKFQPGPTTQAATNAHARVGATVLKTLPEMGWQRVRIPAGKTVQQAIAEYGESADVLTVQPNYTNRQLTLAPNDSRYTSGEMYGLNKINAPAAWNVTTGKSNIVVAVFDTGINHTHQDLIPNLWSNTQEIAGNGIDDDSNGYIDDIHGIDVFADDGDPRDSDGHGSHTSGTIGAKGNNGIGVVGVNWNVKIMALQIFGGPSGATYRDDFATAEAFRYMVFMKNRGVNIRVSNHSWGGGPSSTILIDAFTSAQNAGILNVCAAGNSSNDNDAYPHYPASYNLSGIVSVAASDSLDNKAGFSNFGATTVDLAAPGVGILSTGDTGTSEYFLTGGTSMASPHVAGAAALLVAKNNTLSVSMLKSALLNGVDAVSAFSTNTVSGGRLNLAKALLEVDSQDQTPPSVSMTAPVNSGSYSAPETFGIIAVGTAMDEPGGSGLRGVEVCMIRLNDNRTPANEAASWNGSSFVAGSQALNWRYATLGANNSWQWQGPKPSQGLSEGVYQMGVRAHDFAAFNDQAARYGFTPSVIFTVDRTSPTMAYTTPPPSSTTAPGPAYSSLAALSGTANDFYSLRTVRASLLRYANGSVPARYWNGSQFVAGSQPIYNLTTLTLSGFNGTWSIANPTPAQGFVPTRYETRGLVHDRSDANFNTGNYTFTAPHFFRITGTGTSSISPVMLSTASATSATQTVQLTFTGALNAVTAGNPLCYTVQVGDQIIDVVSASVAGNVVTLTLPSASLAMGDVVSVTWIGVTDSLGRDMEGTWDGTAS